MRSAEADSPDALTTHSEGAGTQTGARSLFALCHAIVLFNSMPSWLDAAPPEEIDAGSVRLRRWNVDDAEIVTRLVADNLEHLQPWMPWAQQPPTITEEREFLARMQVAWQNRTDFGYAVTLLTSEPIGGIGLHTRQGPGILEIGYWIAAPYTTRGYATAAARALTEAALALPEVVRVEIRCDESNHASAAVPAKLGYRLVEVMDREPSAPGEIGRALIWATHRDERPPPQPVS